ncbi:uncharacterized protein LOC133175262 [Saccostrea echinata]|uniref:uncharacterized protein LOC133175262 n=1 Tax=Saccostrea echinata TaxID=191078 RepID=UPI002A807569|nr:uncharacterized protein LOC133175262 [Saccostrea echinata]
MRIKDFRKNGCFRNYNLSRFTLGSSSIYEPLKHIETTGCNGDPVFYVHQGHLPTHMRSLRLARHTGLQTDRCTSSPTRRILMTAALTALFFVSLLCFFLSIHIWRTKEGDTTEITTLRPELNKTTPAIKMNSERKISNIIFKNSITKRKTASLKYNTRKSCVNNACRMYSAFQFKASCSHGYCQCSGDGYQKQNCLPKYGDCYIQEGKRRFVDALIQGKKSTMYSCQSPLSINTEEKIHVISTFSNSQSDETIVEIFGNSTNLIPVTIVLSNYQKVKWRVILEGVVVKKFYLISHHNLKRSSVEIQDSQGDAIAPPAVEKLFSQVGYGEDRFGGHTVDLLKTINQLIGPVSTFHGVATADRWRLQLNKL